MQKTQALLTEAQNSLGSFEIEIVTLNGANFIKFIGSPEEYGLKEFAIPDGFFGEIDQFKGDGAIKMISKTLDQDQEAGARKTGGVTQCKANNHEVIIMQKNFVELDFQTQLDLYAAFKDVNRKMSAIIKDELFFKFDNDINKSHIFFNNLLNNLNQQGVTADANSEEDIEDMRQFITNQDMTSRPGKIGIYNLGDNEEIRFKETLGVLYFPLEKINRELVNLAQLNESQCATEINNSKSIVSAAILKHEIEKVGIIQEVSDLRVQKSPRTGIRLNTSSGAEAIQAEAIKQGVGTER